MSKTEGEGLLTTGELARTCGVTVRTVQYYDERGLLRPTERSVGGRRLYDGAALERMRTICVLKALGLPLKAIRGVLDSDGSPDVLRCLLQEQEKALIARAGEDEAMLTAVRAELARLGAGPGPDASASSEASPVLTDAPPEAEVAQQDDETGMGRTMSWLFAEEGSRLNRTQHKMLLEGIACDLVELVCIVHGVRTGDWLPLLVVLPLCAIIASELVWMYHRDARYVCPHCHTVFQPDMREFFFASHTPKTHKLTCTSCGTKDWCAEVTAEVRTAH